MEMGLSKGFMDRVSKSPGWSTHSDSSSKTSTCPPPAQVPSFPLHKLAGLHRRTKRGGKYHVQESLSPHSIEQPCPCEKGKRKGTIRLLLLTIAQPEEGSKKGWKVSPGSSCGWEGGFWLTMQIIDSELRGFSLRGSAPICEEQDHLPSPFLCSPAL